MKARARRRKRIFRQVRTNLLVLLAFLVIGVASFHVLRTELLKNAKETGTALAKSYAAEERNNLTVYETLIAFGTEAIDWRVQEGESREELQSWITMYFQRLEDVLGEGTVDPYAILDGQVLAANSWEGMEDYDAYIIDQDGGQRSIYHSTMSNGWTSLVTVPYDTILRELRQASVIFCLIFLFCLLSVGFLTWRELLLSAQMERVNETAAVLGNSCYALYRVDVFQDTYEIIKGSDYVKERLPKTGRYEDLTRVVSEVIEEGACQEYLDSFSAVSLQKLSGQGVREFGGDFLRRFGQEYRWVNVEILFDEILAQGEGVLCFREVEQEKRRQLEERKLLEDALASSRQSEKAKQAFFSNMSHDMRTPLNGIIGLTEVAKKHVEEPEQIRDYLEKITVSGRQLLGLINDILDMSRLEQGKVVLDDRQFDLRDCIEDCAALFRVQAGEEGKDFRVTCRLERPVVLGDPFRLSQIMNNLLSNAFKFTQRGESIGVEVCQLDFQGRAKYRIVVRDTGLGMSREFLPQIFEPYARETRFSPGQVVGTGLGMPIVKSLVTQMSGQIQVESTLGEGTVFTVELPFQSVGRESGPTADQASAEPVSLEGKHILLAEDNAVNMEIAAELLAMHGMKVTQAWDGREAVEAFTASLPLYL